jgi:peroxiredoxin
MKKHILLICLAFLYFVPLANYGQTCFEGYDLLFQKGLDTLPYNEFHQLELEFIESLKGCPAPNFEGKTLEGNDIYLSALTGKVVVLNFWFTNCPPCLKEIPELNKLVDQFNPDEVVFIGLARDDTKELDAFFKRFGIFRYQIIPESYRVATTYKVVAWPQSMVIDKQGNVFKAWAGVENGPIQLANEIKTAIETCLETAN